MRGARLGGETTSVKHSRQGLYMIEVILHQLVTFQVRLRTLFVPAFCAPTRSRG